MMLRGFCTVLVMAVFQFSLARAEPVSKAADRGQAAAVTEDQEESAADIDVGDVVMSAMKTRTTVAEAPAIITVITGEQIRQQGFRRLGEAVGSTAPGFMPHTYAFGLVSSALTRGMLFGTLILHDGIDMYDPVGFPLLTEFVPLHTVSRIEVVSGPGGVLWGANSFVGVMNIVSKGADDVDGVEAGAAWGAGAHVSNWIDAYAMAGAKFFDGELKVFASVTYHRRRNVDRYLPFRAAQPTLGAGATTFDTDFVGQGDGTNVFDFTGNVEWGPVTLHWRLPWTDIRPAVTQNGGGNPNVLGEDSIDCTNPANKAICAARVDPDRLNRFNTYRYTPKMAILRYRDRFGTRLSVDAKAFFAAYDLGYAPLVFVPPNDVLPGGLGLKMDYKSYRGGVSLDTDITLPAKSRLLVGGEVFYDVLPESVGRPVAYPGVAQLALDCPPAKGDNECPVLVMFSSNRLTGGLFVSGQTRIIPTLALSGGARLQVYGGKRSLDPVVLLDAAAVWSFLPDWNLKLNFAEGFRPPSLLKTDGGLNFWDGNPNLGVERSRAVQGELNTRLLRDYKGIRQLTVRVDYSYTWINDFIVVNNNIFQNLSNVGVHSVEFLAKLSMKKGHNVALGYTFTDAAADDVGKLRSIPAQWFTVQGLFNIWKNRLVFSTNLTVFGSFEDPNMYPQATGGQGFYGDGDASGPIPDEISVALWTDRTLDRVGATMLWNAGLRLALPEYHVTVAADAYNIMDVRSYNPEGFMDLSAAFETIPSPWRGFAFLLSTRVHL